MRSLLAAGGLALWAAVAMTFGDWVWATLELRHRMVYGLAHGTLLCLWLGLYLGLLTARVAWTAGIGGLIGLLAAASFYVLAPLLGYSAMFLSWIGLWLALAWLAQPAAGPASAGGRVSWLRALLAASGSGLAFYMVSGIWRTPPSSYVFAWHFVAWTLAFLPGSLALLFRVAR
ncbi:MAG: hypothetical protein ACT4QD_06100 [Acidobacteriota bacterium]